MRLGRSTHVQGRHRRGPAPRTGPLLAAAARDRRGPVAHPPAGHHPSRPEAGQHFPRSARSREDRRLWAGHHQPDGVADGPGAGRGRLRVRLGAVRRRRRRRRRDRGHAAVVAAPPAAAGEPAAAAAARRRQLADRQSGHRTVRGARAGRERGVAVHLQPEGRPVLAGRHLLRDVPSQVRDGDGAAPGDHGDAHAVGAAAGADGQRCDAGAAGAHHALAAAALGGAAADRRDAARLRPAAACPAGGQRAAGDAAPCAGQLAEQGLQESGGALPVADRRQGAGDDVPPELYAAQRRDGGVEGGYTQLH